ncbi:MAG: glycosyltransferase family 2 protein [Patescibacteria group bacterium]
MSLPKVSICIPAYKQIKFLRKNLESIKSQTYQDYEIILTDDSPNNDVKNLVELFDFQGKLRYYKNLKTLGSPENWNEAIRYATGEYIKILHHDDWFKNKNSLSEFVKMLDENPNADFAFCPSFVQYAKDGRTRIHDISFEQRISLKTEPTSLFYGNIIGSPSATIHRRKVNILFDKNLKWTVDFDFYISILNKNSHFAFNPQPLIVNITEAEHNVTNDCIYNKQADIFEYFYVYNKIRNVIPTTRKKKYVAMLSDIVAHYRVKSIKEIRDCGYQNDVPRFVSFLIFLNNFLPTTVIKYCIAKYDRSHKAVM